MGLVMVKTMTFVWLQQYKRHFGLKTGPTSNNKEDLQVFREASAFPPCSLYVLIFIYPVHLFLSQCPSLPPLLHRQSSVLPLSPFT